MINQKCSYMNVPFEKVFLWPNQSKALPAA